VTGVSVAQYRADLRASRLWSAGVVAALSVLIVSVARWGPDWPAQEFRAWVAGHDGLSVWTSRWYGGSALPGYSVLYPLVTAGFSNAVVAAAAVGALSSVAATWVAALLGPRSSRARMTAFGVAVAISVCENLLIGQVPFLLGAALGVAALASVVGSRRWELSATLAGLASLASPLAGTFVLLVAPAVATATGWRRTMPLAAGLAGSLVALAVGGAGGPFPCPWQTFAGVAVFCGAILTLAPRAERTVRVFAWWYLMFAAVLFVVPNPIGGNEARLGKIIVIPLACYFLSTQGTWLRIRNGLIALAALIWPTVAFVSSMTLGATDPAGQPAFYTGLVRYLSHQPPTGRLEIPFTAGHWESYFVARKYPIARGWERQSDLKYNQVLYGPLTVARYRTWLEDNAISLVALPRAPLDYGGSHEARLLRHPPGYLIPVWHDQNWRVWKVAHPTAIVTGAATLADEDASSLTLHFAVAGTAVVRIHASPLWTAQAPGACVGATKGGWLFVRSSHVGTVAIAARINGALITGRRSCAP
jgi:hypothetical protein